jgi:hypothetical protein
VTGPLYPTLTDLKRWRRLVRQAQLMASNPTLPVGDLASAAKEARRAVAPSHEAQLNICSPLIRLAEAYPAMDDGARRENADRLMWLAVALAPLVGGRDRPLSQSTLKQLAQENRGVAAYGAQRTLGLHVPAPEAMIGDPRPEPAPRRDIEG